jgi:uncharacterized protein YabN with tetrapyrrole methylase and pyrophosphatase domain
VVPSHAVESPSAARVRGSLTVVGTGIQLASHLTFEARIALQHAQLVLCLVAEPATRAWLERLNPNTQSLNMLYELDRNRSGAYEAMTEEIARRVREGLEVCAAFYGHPAVCAAPTHEALRRVRSEGFPARMLPGVSAEDCLFADLGLDPSRWGWQSYEATDFLVRTRRVDPSAALVLWQIGTVGSPIASAQKRPIGLPLLVEALLELYSPEHEVVVYEASPYPSWDPLVRRVPLSHLCEEHVTALSTLYVPPRGEAVLNHAILNRLELRRT